MYVYVVCIKKKICRLLLKQGKIFEASDHFHYHIQTYKDMVGFPEIRFQHLAWLSEQ